jgi:hypothetical protein
MVRSKYLGGKGPCDKLAILFLDRVNDNLNNIGISLLSLLPGWLTPFWTWLLTAAVEPRQPVGKGGISEAFPFSAFPSVI